MSNNNQNSNASNRDPKKDGTPLSESRLNDESEIVDQDPGERQKENQNQTKDDPLAA